jgi:hypothetical protein
MNEKAWQKTFLWSMINLQGQNSDYEAPVTSQFFKNLFCSSSFVPEVKASPNPSASEQMKSYMRLVLYTITWASNCFTTNLVEFFHFQINLLGLMNMMDCLLNNCNNHMHMYMYSV